MSSSPDIPELYPGAVQGRLGMRRSQADFLANFSGIKFQSFAHHEHAGSFWWQIFQADLHHPRKILLSQRSIGVTPVAWLLVCMAIRSQQGVDHIGLGIGIGIGLVAVYCDLMGALGEPHLPFAYRCVIAASQTAVAPALVHVIVRANPHSKGAPCQSRPVGSMNEQVVAV